MSTTTVDAREPASAPDPAGAAAPGRRRRRRRWPWVLALLVVVLYLAAAAAMVLVARHHALAGADALEHAKQTLKPADLLAGRGGDEIDAAGDDFARAHALTHSPALWPLRLVPVAGRQLRAMDAMTGAADEAADIGADALAEAQERIGTHLPTGPDRVILLQDLHAIAARAHSRLAALDLGPSKALIGPVDHAHRRLADELGDVTDGLQRASTAADGLAAVLRGPSTYLLLAANNAEMRAGSGMFLSAGLITMRDGNLSIGDTEATPDISVPAGVPISDADYAARWGFATPNEEWRNLGMSPRFAASAQLAASMWAAAGRPPVDGVLAVDVVALQGLLRATGPVDADGQAVAADSVLQLLLHDQYVGVSATDPQVARRERLAAVAHATVDKLEHADADLSQLADELRAAASGRHLMAWANSPATQAAWTAAGVGGELRDDSFMAAVLNRGGNKLDQYLSVEGRMAAPNVAGDGSSAVTVKLHITNSAPADDAPYVQGDNPDAGGPGGYSGFLSVDVPAAARSLTVDGAGPVFVAGGDGPASQVAAVGLNVPRGRSVDVTVSFVLPAGQRQLRIESTARVPAIAWRGPTFDWSDASGPRTLSW